MIDEPSLSIPTSSRETLACLAEVLIPGGQGMPAATEVGIHLDLIDRVLAVCPGLTTELTEVLREADGKSPREFVENLRARDSSRFDIFATAVVGAYFLDEGVRRLTGYPGQEPYEFGYSDEVGYIEDGLLEPVLDRYGDE